MTEQPVRFAAAKKDDVAWLGSEPIPAAPYHDPAWFELEREAVFKRSWLQVAHCCELPAPGSFIRCDIAVARASLLIVRGKDDVIRAFHNVCTHRGTELVEQQSGRQASFSCRYHRWTFAQDGSLLSAPDFERFSVTKAQCGLKSVALEVFAGLIFVHLGTPAQSLREWLGDLADDFAALPIARATHFTEYSYEIAANWKVIYDNFQENYHLRFIHPRTGGPGCTEDNPFAYPLRYNFHGPHRSQTIWSNPNPPDPAPVQGVAYRKIGDAAREAGLFGSGLNLDFICLFPNFTLFGLPSRHFTQSIMPLSAGRSRGTVRFYWVGEAENASERFAREYVMASQRDIHVEDRYVVEAEQRGLATGAIPAINFQVNEALCRHLFHAVDGMVRAYQAELGANA